MLSRYAAVAPADWAFIANVHGRPELLDRPRGVPDLRFNLSHTEGLIACAVTIGREVGVDVEHIGRRLTHDVPARFFAPREVADLDALPGRRASEGVLRLLDAEGGLHQGARLRPGAAARRLRVPLGAAGAAGISFEPALPDDPATWQFAQDWPTPVHRLGAGGAAERRRPADPHPPGRAQVDVKLWATSDLHVGYDENRRAVEALPPHPDDWLIIAGDTGETPAHLDFVLRTLGPRFKQLVWTPGNHDLWTPATLAAEQRGVAHYERLVEICRQHGVLTPEDPYARWPGDGPDARDRAALSAVRLLVPPGARVPRERAVAWAAESGVRSQDEDLLAPDPYRHPRRLVPRARRGDRGAARGAAAETPG